MAEVLYSVEASAGRITINRPEKGNALNAGTLRQLRRSIQDAAADRSVRVITITGAGEKVFCAGMDLKEADATTPGRTDFHHLLLEIVKCSKPVVVLVRGHVLGGGIGIVLAADLSLACDDVHFSTPEIQVGMFPMMVMGLLYRNIGRKRATEMMFLGERIPASQAQEFGIINHAYRRDQFEAASGELVRKLASRSPTILSLGKKAISHVLDEKLAEEESFLESALAEVMETEDSRKALRAFLKK